MLIYLDTNIVQYCADYEDFIFALTDECPVDDSSLREELIALRQLVELDQLGDWQFAAPEHLLAELHAGEPSNQQLRVYKSLHEAFEDNASSMDLLPDNGVISTIDESLTLLGLKDPGDRRHIAEAIALNASWFLTNDKEIIRKCRGRIRHTRVCRPSESLDEISVGLFLK